MSLRRQGDRTALQFSCWFFDYDNDGWIPFRLWLPHPECRDICADYLGLPNNAERPRLYHNNHDGTFTDVTRQTGLYHVLHAMGANFGDLDNDGFGFYVARQSDLETIIPTECFVTMAASASRT